MPLEIYLFGSPRLTRAGRSVTVQRRKGLALLAYLAVTGRAHGRESLVGLFWPELDGASARANLRRELSRLRQELGDDVFWADRAQVAIDPAAWLDIAEFKDRIGQVRRHGHPPGQLCATCAAALAEAAGLYRGDFMAGFGLPDAPAYDEWQFFEAESLHQMLAEGLRQLAAWHAGRGEYQPAIDHARRWLALDPLHEPAHRELIKLYAWAGQTAAAGRQYDEAVHILDEELGVAPEPETAELMAAVRARRLPPPGAPAAAQPGPALPYAAPQFAAPPSQLPAFPTPLIGRAGELARLAEMLADPAVRLVTITGVGGMGKTRLALAAARAELAADRFPHGVYFVALAPLTDDGQIAAALADALRLSSFAEETLQRQTVDFLRPMRLLLVLDNFEHLLTAKSAALLADILAAAPDVKILVTSRTRLGLQSEQLFALDGLAFPVPMSGGAEAEEGRLPSLVGEAEGYGSVQLFRQSARRVRPEFTLTAANLPAVLQICRQLQGMPLGIELAAAWVELLSPAEIAAELARSLDFLAVDSLDVPERQRSLRAVFDAAWQMLSAAEREAMKRLTVFQGSFTRPAAEAVARLSLKELLALANKSWLQRADAGRYQIHPLLRQYAAEALRADAAARQEAHQRHATYFAAHLAELDRQMKGPHLREAFAEVAADYEDIRHAWRWLVAEGAFAALVEQMLPAFFRYCESRGKSHDMLALLDEAVARLKARYGEAEPLLLAMLLTAEGSFEVSGTPMRFETFGIVTAGREEIIRRAWDLIGLPERHPQLGFWAVTLVYLYGHVFDRDLALGQIRPLIAYFRANGWLWELGFALHMLGMLLTLAPLDDAIRDETEACVAESLALFERVADAREAGYVLRLLGQLRRLEGRFNEAIQHWRSAQAKLEAAGDRLIAADIYWQMGDAYLQLGDHAAAFDCYRAMNDYQLATGNTWMAGRTVSKESYEAVRYGDLAYAREKREQSLALARMARDAYAEAWSTWEAAELERVAGDLAAARQWAERARILFEQTGIDFGLAFYYRLLGDIAHVEGQYGSAAGYFEASGRIARDVANGWATAYALTGLGRALTAQGDCERGRQVLAEALTTAEATGDVAIVQVARAALAELHAALGEPDRAAELSRAVIGHPAAWKETKARAAAVLAALDPAAGGAAG